MPTFTEPSKTNVVYHEPSAKGWFVARWFVNKWFGKGRGEPVFTEPSKTNVTYNEPSKGS